MSRILTVARADLRRARRERLPWGAVVLLGAMFLPSTAAVAAGGHRTLSEHVTMLPLDLMTFALVVVAAVGYDAVVGERAAGTVRFVLGLPATRRDLVLGKLLARAVVVAVALTAVLAVANALLARGYGRPALRQFWTMGAWMVAYAVVWTAVTVGYSAAFASGYRALGALVGTYAVFSPDVGLWGAVVRPAFALAFTGSATAPSYERLATAPLWLRATERLNPLVDVHAGVRWSLEAVGPGTPVGGPLPHVAGTAVVVLFGAVPLAVGVRRLDGADLGDEPEGPRWGDRLWRSLAGLGAAVTAGRSVPSRGTMPSRTLSVARADLRHALQSWVLLGATVLVVVLTGPSLWGDVDASGIRTVPEVLRGLPDSFALPLLVLGVALGYGAVAGERESGTVGLVLAVGAARRDVVAGAVLSRLVLAGLALVPLLALAEALVVLRFGDLYLGALVAWGGWVLLFGLVWTAAVTGLSAAVSTRYRALAAAVGTYVLFSRGVGLWDPVVRPLVALAFTGTPSVEGFVTAADGGPPWFRYADHLNPFVALGTVREGLFVATGHAGPHTVVGAPLVLYSLAVTVLFAGVPLALGARRFERADLG